MLGPRVNLWLVLLAALGLLAVHAWAPRGLYTFGGHGRALHRGELGFFWLLALTHALFALVIWAQRRRWDASESATFLFVAMKGMFWAWLALTVRDLSGVDLDFAYLLVVLTLSTTNADIQLVRRYLFQRKESES